MADDPSEGMILLDVSAGGDMFDQTMLERLGHPVKICPGPDHGALCPILKGKNCQEFEEAHGIIFELDLDRPQHRAIVRRYRELARADVPIRVVVSPDHAERYADELAGIEVLTHDSTVADLDGFAAQVEAADRT
jgi:hypothetical protein